MEETKIMKINNRTQLIDEAKQIYLNNLGDTTQNDFFYLKTDSESNIITEFHINKLHNTKINKNHSNDHFVLSTIPNAISGSLSSAKVIILNLNMGAGKNGPSFLKDIINYENNSQYIYSPTTSDFITGKNYSFSQTMFYYAFNKNLQMRADLKCMLSDKFDIIRAQCVYEKIKNNLIKIYSNSLNLASTNKEIKNNFPSLYNDLKRYYLDFSDVGINTLGNFYRQMLIPILQLKFPFEVALHIHPIFIATDPYYVPIDNKGSERARFLIKPHSYTWNGKNNWLNYTFEQQNISFSESLLAKVGVKSMDNIMLIQLYPYSSNKFYINKNTPHDFGYWKKFVCELVNTIDDYNHHNSTDQIQLILNRSGNNYVDLNSLKHTSIWTRKENNGSHSGYLSSKSFKKL